jgi:hypothetical protein
MSNLPNVNDLTSGTTTEAAFQTALGALYAVLSELCVLGPTDVETIASDVITPSKGIVTVETEGSASTDTINLINPVNLNSKVIILRLANTGRTVTLKHNQSGTGKLWLLGEADTVLNNPSSTITLFWNDTTTRWEEITRNYGLSLPTAAEVTAAKTLLGINIALAPLANPSFTGAPAAPTPTAGDNSTRIATTAWVLTELTALASSMISAANTAIAAYVDASGKNSQGAKTVSTSAPIGGNNGDIHYRV